MPVGTTDWLADLLGPNIYDSGVLIQPNTNDLNFIGPTIAYNPATRQVDIIITSGAGSTLVVSNIVALSVVDDLALSDGAIAAMASVKDLWWLDKASTLGTDGITVIGTASGAGRWVRACQSHLSWRKQTTWHINQATGNDEADGSTVGTAIASHDEFQRRVADQDQPIAVDMLVTFEANYTGDIKNAVSVSQVSPYGSITYQGSRSVIFSGSVTAATAWATGTTVGTFDDAALPASWTASGGLNQLCVLTSGVNAGAASWIIKEPVAKTARYSGFWNELTFGVADPAITDTYQVVSLTQIVGKITQIGAGYTIFRNLDIQPAGGFDTQIQIYGGYVGFSYCSLEVNSMAYSGGGTFGHGFFGCKVNATTSRPRFFNCEANLYGNWFLGNVPFAASGARLNVPARNVAQQATGGPTIDKALAATKAGFVEVVLGGEWVVLDLVSAASRALRCENFGRIKVDGTSSVWGQGNTYDHGLEVNTGGVVGFATPAASRFVFPGATVSGALVGSVTSPVAGLPVFDFSTAAAASELT